MPVGRGAIAVPLPQMAGVGIVDARGYGKRYIVESDELLSAFLELELTLLQISNEYPSTVISIVETLRDALTSQYSISPDEIINR